jgi:DNA polymerase-3 subunit alpha
MPGFVHLHTHSYFSFLEGLSSPEELAQAASKNGMKAIAMTDRNSLTGAIEFFNACQAARVQPILGLQLTVESPIETQPFCGDLVLFAQDLSGWRSLCRLSSNIQSDPENNPGQILTFNQLAAETSGLICMIAGTQSCFDQLVRTDQMNAARRYLETLGALFPGSLYIALQRRTLAEINLSLDIVKIAAELDTPVVATNQVFYLENDQSAMQKLVSAIRLNKTTASLAPAISPPPGSYFTSTELMTRRFEDLPESLTATEEIAERCQFELPLNVPRFPQAKVPQGFSMIEALEQKAKSGAKKRYGELNPQITERLNYELSVIENKGYTPLFLIMEEIVSQARLMGIPISSRGSAASSLVAYCLEITSPDPLKLDLYFERFLNPARESPPDIDTDICSRRRDELIRYVYERFGAEHVAMVATINRFRRRSALRECAKAHGFSSKEVEALINHLPRRWRGGPSRYSELPYEQLGKNFPQPRYQQLFQDAANLIGVPRHLSIHPGGLVISPEPMTDIVPVQLANKGVVITQFDLDSVSQIGLVKIDLLGIRGLTVLGDVAEQLQKRNPNRYESPLDALEDIPEQDLATAEVLQSGRTIGCFQIESPGMRATLKEIQAQTMEDLMIALALYRPGPLTGGLKDAFVRRHRGEEKISHLHPALSEILADTYGVILYQEQVLRIAHQLAGLSLADADLLRRAMSHFDPGEQMRTLRHKFIAGAGDKSQIPKEIAEHVWELMAAFAGYGFPKAHAASYAQIAWRAAWSKTHHPAYFMASVLANWGGYYRQPVYINEARRLGLKLRGPHVNFSQHQFSVSHVDQDPILFMGLDQVLELTHQTQKRIIHSRPFHSLQDFLIRVDPRSKEIDHLVRVGAFDGLGQIPELLSKVKLGGWQAGQMSLFTISDETAQNINDWSLEQKAAAQKQILGISIIAHPLQLQRSKIEAAGATTTAIAATKIGQRVRVAGLQFTSLQRRSRKGITIYLLDLEDLEGMLLVVIPENIYQRYRSVFSREHPFVVEGEISLQGRFNEPAISAERVWRL